MGSTFLQVLLCVSELLLSRLTLKIQMELLPVQCHLILLHSRVWCRVVRLPLEIETHLEPSVEKLAQLDKVMKKACDIHNPTNPLFLPTTAANLQQLLSLSRDCIIVHMFIY